MNIERGTVAAYYIEERMKTVGHYNLRLCAHKIYVDGKAYTFVSKDLVIPLARKGDIVSFEYKERVSRNKTFYNIKRPTFVRHDPIAEGQ